MTRSVTDPRSGKRVALKKMPNIFKNITSAKRAFRELKMLCTFDHDNVSIFAANLVRIFTSQEWPVKTLQCI